MEGICKLCGQHGQTQLSHFIPKFVYTWTKETGSGFLRSSKEPNVRFQDGLKDYILCPNCEQLFSSWEKAFYESLFLPLHDQEKHPTTLDYGDWALKFAVSVSWRTLLYHKQYPKEFCSHLSPEQLIAVDTAFEVWRDFLLGKRRHPAEYEQHILPLDLVLVENHSIPNFSPFINRYLLRSIEMTLVCNQKVAFTYTKMNRIALFGFLQMDDPKIWQRTKLHVRKGTIGSKQYLIPYYLIEYFSERANQIALAYKNISKKQRSKMGDLIRKDPDRLTSSEAFRAMVQDVNLFGKKAFGHEDDKNTGGS